VESALASMGNASGKTAEELQKSAKQLETFSNFDDDDILRKVTANLLTFGNVSGEAFDRAQQAAVDLSARLGSDLQSATLQVGKALNDPVLGLTALSRTGIQFTEDQKELVKGMVEMGDIAGAQALILAELEKQFGGAARAAREAAPGGDQAQAWRTLQEVIGERLVVAFEKLEQVTAPIINSFLALDEDTQTMIVTIGALAAAIGPALVVFGMMAQGIGAIITLGPAIVAVFGAIKVAALALMANPILLGFAAVLAGIYLAWQNWDKIEPIVRRLYEGVKKWIMDKLGPVFDWVGRKVEAVTGFFKDMYTAVVGNSYVPDMVEGIGREFDRLQSLMVDPAQKAAKSTTDAMRDMASEVQGLLNRLFPEIARMRAQAADLALLDQAESLGLLSGETASQARRRALGATAGEISEDLQKLDRGIGSLENMKTLTLDLGKTVGEQSRQIADSFGTMADRALQALDRLAQGIQRGDFLSILGGILNIGLQLGGMGLFGQRIATNINSQARANGGMVSSGNSYLVGERGPEIFTPNGSGFITPNGGGGGGGQSVVVINNSALAEAFVQEQITATAPAIMQGAAQVTQQQMSRQARRRT